MLEKVVGPGHVDVRVTAELDRARVERVEEHYDPKTVVLRSEEQQVERAPGEAAVGGVPGAESNLPGASGRGAGADGGVEAFLRESHTRNFEVDKVSEKRIVAPGSIIRRLTVAVVVDEAARKGAPIKKEEVDRMASLVRSAVGADDRRGDQVTVDAAPFLESAPPDAPAPPKPLYERVPRKAWPYVGGGVGVLALLTILMLRRALSRRAKAVAQREAARTAIVVAQPVPEPPPEIESELARLDGAALRQLVHDRSAQDPATAALVLRFWLGPGPERDAHDVAEGAEGRDGDARDGIQVAP